MSNPSRRRALTMSFLNPSKLPPSSPIPKPSNPDFQPPQFSLPPSSCEQSICRINNGPPAHDSILVPEELEGDVDGILSSSAPSAPYSMRQRMNERYSDSLDFGINFPSNKESPSFRLSGFESPNLTPTLNSFIDEPNSMYSLEALKPLEEDLLPYDIISKNNLNFNSHTTPLTTRSSSTFSSNMSFHKKFNHTYKDEYHKQESDSRSSFDFSSDDDTARFNSKNFSTSPLLRYTLETMKLKGYGVDDHFEPPEITLDHNTPK